MISAALCDIILQFGRDEGDAERDAALKGDGGFLGAPLYLAHALFQQVFIP